MLKPLSTYQKNKQRQEKISNFIYNFFRVFSVIKRYERGNPGTEILGLANLYEEGEPTNAYRYKIDWALKEIDNILCNIGQFSGEIEGVFLASFEKIMEELKGRAEKFYTNEELKQKEELDRRFRDMFR